MRSLLVTKILLGFLCIGFISCNPTTTSDSSSAKANHMQLETLDYDKKLKDLNIELVEISPPVANYVNVVRTGNLLFFAGKGPKDAEGKLITGKVGKDLTVEEGYEAAKRVAIAQLSVLKNEVENLNRVKSIVKVLGMVNCTNDFTYQPEVINGFSDTMVEIFGDKGKHARAAVGMNSLPRDIAVEIEMIVELYE